MSESKKRFIAGAVCPACSEMDRILMWDVDGLFVTGERPVMRTLILAAALAISLVPVTSVGMPVLAAGGVALVAGLLWRGPDATEIQMVHAAERAEAHDFIQTLSDPAGRHGYDAHVGERGVKLSGGQRQRVTLARVILKDAPILVLDEATSALDSEVEAAIQDTLYGVMEGKTVIAIAHRLSTIARMDRIVVLDGGHIVEAGTHAELLAQGGLYAGFWARQSGGFLGTDAEAAE